MDEKTATPKPTLAAAYRVRYGDQKSRIELIEKNDPFRIEKTHKYL